MSDRSLEGVGGVLCKGASTRLRAPLGDFIKLFVNSTLIVEQVVVYSTLPQEYSTLTFRGEVVAGGGGVEERSKVMYWHRGAYIIYYRDIMCHSYTA